MEYAKLGKSGIEVSRLCVGCMSFGRPSEDFHEWTLNPNETEEIVKKALDLGINFFDTANTYSHGTSEEYLGRALIHVIFSSFTPLVPMHDRARNTTEKSFVQRTDENTKNIK